MKRIIYILIISCVFVSCVKSHDKTVEIISLKEAQILEKKMNLPQPFPFRFHDVYFLDKNGYIHKNNLNNIKQWYVLGHINNYKSLADYIYVIFNQKLDANDSITIKSMTVCCKIDSTVIELYRNTKIEGIMDKYCTYDKDNKCYQLNGFSSFDELETVSYFFFINRYTKFDSDDTFTVFFHPFPDDFERIN